MQNRVPTRIVPDLDFTPVPRKYRHDGWTPERQRAFIAALAETASVKSAAARINMSPEGAYHLRRQPGADGFRAAWDAALDHGVQRLTDLAIDRVIEGVPVPVFWRGEQVGERRRFNDRLHMFILKHHLPGRYGDRPLNGGTKHPDTLAREAAESAAALATDPAAQAGVEAELIEWLGRMFTLYRAKLAAERRHRLAGQVVAADFTLRQALEVELLLTLGGAGRPLLDLWREARADGACPAAAAEAEPAADPRPEEVAADADPAAAEGPGVIADILAELRAEVWQTLHDPHRPAPPMGGHTGRWGGPTWAERDQARAEAQRRIAVAQAVWEAAATEEGWARFKGLADS